MKKAIEKNLNYSTDKATLLSYLDGAKKMLSGYINGKYSDKALLSYYKENPIDQSLYKSVADRLIENQIYPDLIKAYVDMKNSPDNQEKSTIYNTQATEAKEFIQALEEFENDSYGQAVSSYKSLSLFINKAN